MTHFSYVSILSHLTESPIKAAQINQLIQHSPFLFTMWVTMWTSHKHIHHVLAQPWNTHLWFENVVSICTFFYNLYIHTYALTFKGLAFHKNFIGYSQLAERTTSYLEWWSFMLLGCRESCLQIAVILYEGFILRTKHCTVQWFNQTEN